MREVHLRTVDLNLLHALHALLEERHVTRAAKRCFLSQSAMSRALDRLRETLGDPLLVRTGRAYERTVRGERVLRELESIMGRLGAMVQGEEFSPARSQERFRVAMTDHGSTILLPTLLERVRKAAPRARLEVSAWNTKAYEDVVAGRIDLALSAEAVPPILESELIFDLDFVCLVGSAQAVRTRRFTLKQYLQLPHALVETLDGQQTMVDRPLAQLGVKRRVALRLPFFYPRSSPLLKPI
jgi:DNA-binding transcriptional LysR family regulator